MPYTQTFISVADDCPTKIGVIPPSRGNKPTIALIEFELLKGHPYQLDHRALIYALHVQRSKQTSKPALSEVELFARGHPCLRASPLTKRYGWGAHYNEQGKIALFPLGSPEYENLSQPDSGQKQLKAMRSKRI